MYARKRWRRAQYIAEQLWNKWRHEYLPSLQERKKWNEVKGNLMVNDIVIIHDEGLVRGQWKLGLIKEIFAGEDGLVRKVSLKTAKREILERPIHKLVYLCRCPPIED